MAGDCIFCRIAAHDAEASVVFDDAQVMAFMDVRAFHPGHTLVIPKRHVDDITGLDDQTLAGALMLAVASVARGVQRAFATEGITVWQSNGAAAGQEVFHVHFHVMPRYAGDGLLRVYPSRPDYPDRSGLDEHAQRIRQSMAG
jgi:histidine triad (HIT) family protein